MINNIIDEMNFSSDKPGIVSILKTDRINYLAVGLLEGQFLPKHQTLTPTLLTVLKGEIEIYIEDKEIVLCEGDVYKIPIKIEHEVKGLDEENIFTLIQEK
jgi:quercetin dioxygenase-like cupin family protein